MTRISPRHPRFASLRTRTRLAEAVRRGLVVPEGLIAHGRGEAFDYFLGERSTPSARSAERLAARWIANARLPVLSVNGNVAALAAGEVAQLARAFPHLRVEVNLFHRTTRRARSIARALARRGVRDILGVRPTARLDGLDSDRARIDARGIALADLCLIPLEDGDRAIALRASGKRVISIDLNPMSRTSRAADLPIVDELARALRGIADAATLARAHRTPGRFPRASPARLRREALRAMRGRLSRGAPTDRPRREAQRASRRRSP